MFETTMAKFTQIRDLSKIVAGYSGEYVLDHRLQKLIDAGIVGDLYKINDIHSLENPRIVYFMDRFEGKLNLAAMLANPNPMIVEYIIKNFPNLRLSEYIRSPHVNALIRHYKPILDPESKRQLLQNPFYEDLEDIRHLECWDVIEYAQSNPAAINHIEPILKDYVRMRDELVLMKEGKHPTLNNMETFRRVNSTLEKFYEEENTPFFKMSWPRHLREWDREPALLVSFTTDQKPYVDFLRKFYRIKHSLDFDKLASNPESYRFKNMFPELANTKGFYQHCVKTVDDLKGDSRFQKFCERDVLDVGMSDGSLPYIIGLFDNPRGATLLKEMGILESVISIYGLDMCLRFPDVHEAVPDVYERMARVACRVACRGKKWINMNRNFLKNENLFVKLTDVLMNV